MADATFFQNSWIISSPPTRAYPQGRWVSIGKDPTLPDRFAVSWLDADGVLHVLRQLQLTGEGKLVGPVVEVGPNTRWIVTIEQVPGTENIQGTVARSLRAKKDPIVEANLAGTWGADAPPPFDDDPRH
jgi:hypothetical protein